MKKDNSFYVCAQCGYQSVRWLGKCPNCNSWNSFAEEITVRSKKKVPLVEPQKINEISLEQTPRIKTGIGEFDRVLGGGLVRGSLILLAGEPGIGKSTILLTLAGKLSEQKQVLLYVSGEESLSQIKLRAERLGVSCPNLFLLSSPEKDSIEHGLKKIKPDVVIIDSIQAICDTEIPTTPGSVTQVRENAAFFMNYAKKTNTPIFLIGHITKEGSIAGPKILEHIVDIVLYFEGDNRSNLRILRGIKNRFGSTTEIGVFSMEEKGLREIPEASALFLQDYQTPLPGSVIFPSLEGSRTILVEIQSLVTPTHYGIPKRTVTGIDYNRVSLILAVLEKKLHYSFAAFDVYVNTGGGFRIDEPGCDLAVSVACVSSLKDALPEQGNIYMGEISLTGEIRPVSQINVRLKEAQRLGFRNAFIPQSNAKEISSSSINVHPVKWLKEAIQISLFNKNKTSR